MSEESQNEPFLVIDMPDGSKWAVPVSIIARNRAAHYAHEFDGDIERSLTEDTLPLFQSDNYEVHDWAANNMNWSEVSEQAIEIWDGSATDYQEGWMNGEYEVQSLPLSLKEPV